MSTPTADGQVPPLYVDYDGSWIEVDLQADLDDWAEKETRLRLEAAGVEPKRREVSRRADHLATMARLAMAPGDCWSLFLLSPGADGQVVAAARVVLVQLGDVEDETPAELARSIVAPEGLNLVEPPEVTELQSAAGPAVRGRVRVASASDSRQVTELLTYAWVFPGYPMAVALTTAFTDLVEAGRWRPNVDALATGVSLDTGS